MKNSLIILSVFALGILAGLSGILSAEMLGEHTSIVALHILVLFVGISLGTRKDLKELFYKQMNLRTLSLPLCTIVGTLLFTVIISLLIPRWSIADCLAANSGFAYYSLSSVLIADLKEPILGAEMAMELGIISLLANIIREIIALLTIPLFARFVGKEVPITVAGVTSLDVCLPLIRKYSGEEMVPVAILHGFILEFCVPLLVTFFCRF